MDYKKEDFYSFDLSQCQNKSEAVKLVYIGP